MKYRTGHLLKFYQKITIHIFSTNLACEYHEFLIVWPSRFFINKNINGHVSAISLNRGCCLYCLYIFLCSRCKRIMFRSNINELDRNRYIFSMRNKQTSSNSELSLAYFFCAFTKSTNNHIITLSSSSASCVFSFIFFRLKTQ